MVVAAADNNFVDFDYIISKEILAKDLLRPRISDIAEPKSLSEAFDIIHISGGNTGNNWVYVNNQSSGGFLTRGLPQKSFEGNFNAAQKVSDTSPKAGIDFSAMVSTVKSTFSLTDEQLASVLQSTRKTVHNWATGSSRPNKTKAQRVLELHDIAKMWNSRGYSVDKDLLSWADGGDDLSLLDLLSQQELDKKLVMFQGSSMFMSDLAEDIDDLEDPFA
ncbi:conserved hypothetical protein [Vibrio chagasii]|nr:conserved hypothetical protein [Vibrio chagasii]